ncbi:CaiB/BaiF CoA transferase family protein [Nitratireductor pacificus]|uniref:Formyl-CoA transferase n=1 Tax=Nitratireductor pacificus pht-3B TaxID=391937 RepID=K2N8N2_9HYPH|nr:CoA transferase [Nitratireductor pacificus]EKF20468.1 formyl-CoA transferase [Nitratireductor pacificus pht-3B]
MTTADAATSGDRSTGPLSGLRVLAVEQYGAGPFGTQHLADLGADIVKIENFRDGGDVSRLVGPHFIEPGDSLFFQAFNRNKRSIGLDLKHPDGQVVLRRLASGCDAVFNNLRGDLPAVLGLDHAALSEVREDIVCVHLSAYGREGSRAAWPGYDYLMQAETGYLSLTGEPGGPPARMGLSIIDLMAGTTAAMALLSGVIEARRTGRGRDHDVSLFDVALHNLAYLGTWYLEAGARTERLSRSAHPSLTPSQLYRTRNGWIFLMCNKEKFWKALVEAIGRPDLAEEEAFADFAARLANRDALTRILDGELQREDTAVWVDRFAAKVPCAPVNDLAGALESRFVAERASIRAFSHPKAGSVRGIASPVRVSGYAQPLEGAPAMSQSLDEVLGEAGFTAEEIQRLKDCRAIL